MNRIEQSKIIGENYKRQKKEFAKIFSFTLSKKAIDIIYAVFFILLFFSLSLDKPNNLSVFEKYLIGTWIFLYLIISLFTVEIKYDFVFKSFYPEDFVKSKANNFSPEIFGKIIDCDYDNNVYKIDFLINDKIETKIIYDNEMYSHDESPKKPTYTLITAKDEISEIKAKFEKLKEIQ